MKKGILGVLIVFVLTLAASQMYVLSAPLIEANIPLAFTIQGKNLPAGRYAIDRVWSSNTGILVIRSNDNRFKTIFSSDASEKALAPKETELVFDKLGNHYFLREVWTVGENIGRDVPEAKAEKELRSTHLALTHVSVLARG